MRPTELMPKFAIEELLRLYKINKNWISITTEPTNPGQFRCDINIQDRSWLRPYLTSGREMAMFLGMSHWLGNGPKCIIPTQEQCQAMQQVTVNLPLEDYQQPYPATVVKLTGEEYLPFLAVLCFVTPTPGISVFHLISPLNKDDITTVVRGGNAHLIEEDITNFREDCDNEKTAATLALRTAVNLNLAMVNYDTVLSYLYPKEVSADQGLSKERSERGERARNRLAVAVQRISFSQEIQLHKEEKCPTTTTKSSNTVNTHWRKGHWAMQPYGEKNTLRKRIFRKPVLVRSDLFSGNLADTATTYKG